MLIKTKRVYEEPSESDGFRVLVDRLWPRRLAKNKVKMDLWIKEISPSDELRRWFEHDPKKWAEFKRRYFEELNHKKFSIDLILNKARKETVTLLYAARNKKFNNAVALKEFIESRIGS